MTVHPHDMKFLLRYSCGVAFGIAFLSMSCADQSQKKICSDPLGSQNITINTSTFNYNNCFFCFKPDTIIGIDTCIFNYCFQLYSSAPQVIKSTYFKNCSYGSIVDIGSVSCLGEVNVKPTSGYVYSVIPELNHGYIVSFPDGTFGRFFIDSWIIESGQVTTMNIVRQYPF